MVYNDNKAQKKSALSAQVMMAYSQLCLHFAKKAFQKSSPMPTKPRSDSSTENPKM